MRVKERFRKGRKKEDSSEAFILGHFFFFQEEVVGVIFRTRFKKESVLRRDR